MGKGKAKEQEQALVKVSGAELLLNSLVKEGVKVIFGYPGGTVLSIYDALLHSPIRHILPRHEQAAVHAADAYARVSGEVGVCLGTSGPGATNLVTGIATAYMDSIPMVILTGQVQTTLLGTDSFQEVDISGITIPITKHSYIVKDASQIPRIVKEAFYIARTGRPGPVLIDLPKDIQAAFVEPTSDDLKLKSYKFFSKGNAGQIEEAARVLAECERPILYAGGGVISSGAGEILRKIVEKGNLPVVTTLMGMGSLPTTHPNLLGMVGMHGTVSANYAVNDCDLLIAVGVRFDDRVTSGLGHKFATKAKIIHIDIDPAEIGKVVKTHIPIVGDARNVLEDLSKHLVPPQIDTWWKQIREWQKEQVSRQESYENTHQLTPQDVIRILGEKADPQAIVTTDVGQHQMWAAQYYPVSQPRRFITSGGLGAMGFGLPAAIGAQVADPDAQVFLITGDGSFQMCIQELATTVQCKLPIKIILLNNGVLGMVRQLQKLFYDERYSQIQLRDNPDFIKVAEAYHILGIRVTCLDEVESAFDKAIAYDGPVLIDFTISEDELVFPMVPSGNELTDMIGR
ncbi:biosynthetic-type acetolactate synthase large subunit [Desulfitobacterium metallireducens]|uniref:Acetolactate synthase n=1 Tax=Desulfitobacterium metallireducens DSM 15288 TaxID=871968 RepID=W0EC15_9FIRM|nr:biosynthetic-type acetolactate synthase large subunit [Desulfitobacterium metallireducens]AHF06611.1 acetolactate synthase [Desulfitobacterium metallireducens DSM 15288]